MQAPTLSPRTAFFQTLGLDVLVFSAGGVLMGLEIAGSRVLAPHFGNSVFVWGSLISVFLIALSLGYYIGGQLADRYPSRLLLHGICFVVSALMFAIPLYSLPFCESLVAEHWGEQSGPLFASLVLFLPPSLGMGMVSPFAVRLATQSVSSVGKVAGTLYALSTAGSIAGTLITTFVLIPHVGLATILKGLSLVLLATAVLTLPSWHGAKGVTGAAAMTLMLLAWFFLQGPPRTALARGDQLVVDVDTPYHHIAVVDHENTRELRFDRYTESSIVKEPPYRGWFAYTGHSYTDFFALAFLVKPGIEHTLFIGAGGGVGPRMFHMQSPGMEIDVVDIDRKVLELARSHFFLEDDPKIHLIAEDGRMFVRKTDHKYDCVILDAFSIGGRIPFHLVTREFLQSCRDKMTDDGVFVMNINSALEGPLSPIYRSMRHTLDAVFPSTYAFAKDRQYMRRGDSMNVILVATRSKQRIAPEEWVVRAERFQPKSYVGPLEMRQMAQALVVEPLDVADVAVFTDDYAPIETMPFY